MQRILQRVFFSLLFLMLLAPLFTGCDNRKVEGHTLEVVRGVLFYDSLPFRLGSVSLDYARLPHEYWAQRLALVKGLGVNTILVRVPWMLHEPREGEFDFSGACDVREFCRLAQENGLLVWLHIGPYVDSHLDNGGVPWWLLAGDSINVRTRQKKFMDRVARYYRALAAELADSRLSCGGNIALINIEETVGLQANHKGYLSALCDTVRSAGFDNILLTVATTKDNVHQLPLDKVTAAYTIDENVQAMSHFAGVRKHNPNAPVLCFDVSRKCQHVWGLRMPLRNLNHSFARMFEVFEGEGSANVSVALGGTSFGHLAGAEIIDGKFRPYSTAYDNMCIYNESGRYREPITMFREAFLRSASQLLPPKAEPQIFELVDMPETVVASFAPLMDSLPQAVASQQPLTFEECGLGYGAMLYTAKLPELKKGSSLLIEAFGDNAQIFLNGTRVAAMSRLDGDSIVSLPESAAPVQLQILVDAFGRAANVAGYKDRKGIVGEVFLTDARGNRKALVGWENTPIAADYNRASSRSFGALKSVGQPGYYRTTFTLPANGDFFLYTGTWGRGEAWINGHSLGRFWSRGPQQTLYVPGCWLKETDNELLILDYAGPTLPVVEGYKSAILD